MSLFPAYSPETKTDQEETNQDWIRNSSCPRIEKDLQPPTESSQEAQVSSTNAASAKEVDAAQPYSKRDYASSDSSSEVKRPDRKRHKKDSKHKKHKKLDKKYSEEFLRKSKHLESIKSIYLRHCGSSIKPLEAYFISHKRDQSNNGLQATHYSEKVRFSRIPGVLGDFQKRKHSSNKRYFAKSYNRRLWKDAEWIAPLKEPDLAESPKYYIPLTSNRNPVDSYMKNEPPDNYESNDIEDTNTYSEAEYWQGKMKKYNEMLTKTPHDIKLWLEFVRIQDKAYSYIFDHSNEPRKDRKHKNTKVLAERKIAILDTAIGKNLEALDLYLERLQYGKLVWENDFLKNEWLELVESFPKNMVAWQKYLTFWQTHFSVFDMDEVSDAFSFAVRKIHSIWRVSPESSVESLSVGQNMVDISVQLAHVWYQGGYMEKSIALFQALIEFNFFSPNHLRPLEVEEKLEVFEAFWDSKAPRFGDTQAVGWSTFMKKMVPVEFPDVSIYGSNDVEDEILLKKSDVTELWIKLESCRELHHWLPFQSDPDYCEDTERMVEFEVIRSHMFDLESAADKYYLLEQFLSFLAQTECLRRNHKGHGVFDVLRLETLTSFAGSWDFCQSATTNTFMFPIIGPSITKLESEKYFQFICEVVRQSMSICDPSKRKLLLVYLIELHAARFSSISSRNKTAALSLAQTSRKEIKSYLKMVEFRMDLQVFNAFAKYEEVVSGSAEAAKIHSKALSLGLQTVKNFSDNVPLSCSLLEHLKSCIKFQFDAMPTVSLPSEVVSGIASVYLELKYTPNVTVNSASIVKVRHKLNTLVDTGVKELGEQSRCDSLLPYHLYFYCIIQVINSDFEAVRTMMVNTINTLTIHKEKLDILVILEKIYEDYLWLIEAMMKIRNGNAGQIMDNGTYRSILTKALSISPRNETFLLKFSQAQTWRDMLGFNSLCNGESSSVLSVIYRLLPLIEKTKLLINQTEMGQFSSGHQIEHALESAVKSPEGMSCPLLWRLYLRCCALVRPKGLIDLVYKAINSCPGAKCIYLDSVQLVPEMLNEVARLMEEKKMRIRLPLEELHVLMEDETNSPFREDSDSE